MTFITLIALLGILGGFWGLVDGVREQRAVSRSVGVRLPSVEERERKVDRVLWDLLKDEDPLYLECLGIEAPPHPRPGQITYTSMPGELLLYSVEPEAIHAVEAGVPQCPWQK